jgi:hypothetical protein
VPTDRYPQRNHIEDIVMKHALTSFAICLALLVPSITSAKKPAPPDDPECALLLAPDPLFVHTGSTFTVKLVRVPSYPGAFRQPTVTIDVTYPMPAGSELTQNYTRSIPKFNVTYAEADFTVPLDNSGILTGQDVEIAATVTEPVGKSKKREKFKTTSCTTTATVLYAM